MARSTDLHDREALARLSTKHKPKSCRERATYAALLAPASTHESVASGGRWGYLSVKLKPIQGSHWYSSVLADRLFEGLCHLYACLQAHEFTSAESHGS